MVSNLPALDGIFPLCLNQEQVLLSAESARRRSIELPPSLIRFGFGLPGRPDADSVRRGLMEIVHRHASLRVIFSENLQFSPPERERKFQVFLRTGVLDPGLHMQSVVNGPQLSIARLDLSSQNQSQQDVAIQKLLNEEELRAFSHSEVPRIRAFLLETGINESLLILFLDHLVCDGASVPIIRKELEYFLYGRSAKAPAARRFQMRKRNAGPRLGETG